MTVVAIAGMHRSGTSMVSRLLSMCGLYLGQESDIRGSAPDNLEGFWENKKFGELNDAILSDFGGGWDLPPALPGDWSDEEARISAARAKGHVLLREFKGSETWGWKDPRNSLTLGFWQSLLPDLRVVICVRNPLEVALSLHRRNTLSYTLAFNLWKVYNERALDLVPPDRRIVTHYDAYFHDVRGEVESLLYTLAMGPEPAAVEACCAAASRELRHSRFTIHDLLNANPSPDILDLYLRLCEEAKWLDDGVRRKARTGSVVDQSLVARPRRGLPEAPANQGLTERSRVKDDSIELVIAREELRLRDEAIGRLNEALAMNETLRAQTLKDLGQRNADLNELQMKLAQQDMQEAQLAHELAERNAVVADFEARIVDHERQRGESAQELAERNAVVADLEARMADEKRRGEENEQELVQRNADLSEVRLSLAQQETQLAESKAAVADLEARMADEKRRGEENEQELAQRNADLNELRLRLAQQETQIAQKETEIAEQEARLPHHMAERNAAVADLEARVAEHERQSAESGQELAHKKAVLSDVLTKLAAEEARGAQSETPPVAPEAAPPIAEDAQQKRAHYLQLVDRIRSIVPSIVPADAAVVVVSRGDPELLDLGGRQGWHFPQTSDGEYAGYYPADSGAATNHLEELRKRGASFLLIPGTASWWLEHYGEFREHLDSQYQCVWSDHDCVLYRLTKQAGASNAERRTRGASLDVVCFPVIDWEFRFQRPQQLLTQFAQAGHRVFYVRTRFQHSHSQALVEDLADGVYGVQLPGPVHTNLYEDEITPSELRQLTAALDEFRRRNAIGEAICVVDLPFWAPLAREAKKRWGWKVIYDCLDDHSGFATNKSTMLCHEEALVRESDLVLATSVRLYERLAPEAQETLLLHNATDFEHFASSGKRQPLDGVRHPIIGYYGAISTWFDVEMVRDAAMARPDWNFVLIGDTAGAEVGWLEALRNVHLLGEKSYDSLPDYLHQFDVACIPFRLLPLTEATNPVKFYEYLSAGKPVVSVDLPELAPYRDYYYPVRDSADFVRQIDAALEEDSPADVRARKELAQRNTWRGRYATLSAAIKPWYGKAAVIIVSYGNREYLELCLTSIWENTLYPNFEVIVVDNASGPEVTDLLREMARQEARLKLILNDENLGFARANNLGIQAAGDPEYIVLLNDDAVVTRGWLGKMVRYLQDPRIGLVGPVTNWAGNEARINVPYQKLEEIEEFAASYMREHNGQAFDIPMLALFCVGIRKSLLDKIGPLDERFGIGMFEDDDFSKRVRRAWYRVVCAEDIFIHHWGRASFSRLDEETYDRLFEENRQTFEEIWGEPWQPHRARNEADSSPTRNVSSGAIEG